jgi:hypothetical protein
LLSSVIDTRDKFITGVVVTGENCSAVSTTPDKFIAGINDTADH